TDFLGNLDATAAAVVLQPDGKVVTVGTANAPTVGATGASNVLEFVLTRTNPNGSPDGSFGAGGVVLTAFDNATATALGAVLQPDGKIVVAGTTSSLSSPMVLARYLPNGSLDTTFGAGGKVTTGLEYVRPLFTFGHTHLKPVTLQPDGKLVVAGATVSA